MCILGCTTLAPVSHCPASCPWLWLGQGYLAGPWQTLCPLQFALYLSLLSLVTRMDGSGSCGNPSVMEEGQQAVAPQVATHCIVPEGAFALDMLASPSHRGRRPRAVGK